MDIIGDVETHHEEGVALTINHEEDIMPEEFNASLDTDLFNAILNNNLEEIERLLKANANPNALDKDGITPIMYAAAHSKDAMQLLLNYGANANLSYDGSTSLHACVLNDMPELIQPIIDCGANVNALNAKGETPMYLAAKTNSLPELEIFAKNNANFGTTDKCIFNTGDTALHACVLNDMPELIQPIIDFGANVNALNAEGKTPMFLAARNNNISALEILAKNDANFSAFTENLFNQWNQRNMRLAQANNDISTYNISYKNLNLTKAIYFIDNLTQNNSLSTKIPTPQTIENALELFEPRIHSKLDKEKKLKNKHIILNNIHLNIDSQEGIDATTKEKFNRLVINKSSSIFLDELLDRNLYEIINYNKAEPPKNNRILFNLEKEIKFLSDKSPSSFKDYRELFIQSKTDLKTHISNKIKPKDQKEINEVYKIFHRYLNKRMTSYEQQVNISSAEILYKANQLEIAANLGGATEIPELSPLPIRNIIEITSEIDPKNYEEIMGTPTINQIKLYDERAGDECNLSAAIKTCLTGEIQKDNQGNNIHIPDELNTPEGIQNKITELNVKYLDEITQSQKGRKLLAEMTSDQLGDLLKIAPNNPYKKELKEIHQTQLNKEKALSSVMSEANSISEDVLNNVSKEFKNIENKTAFKGVASHAANIAKEKGLDLSLQERKRSFSAKAAEERQSQSNQKDKSR